MKKLKKFWKKIKDKGKRINLSPPFKLSKPLNIGVIGAGIQASRLVGQVIDAGAKIVAVHDVKTEAAQKLANLSDSNLSTTNLDEFFDVPMDGLLLCSIPTVRVEPIKRACDKKIHLLIEKPAAHNLNTGQKCLDYIEKADVISSVGFQFRYEPRYEKLKQLIEGQEIHLVRTKLTVNLYPATNVPAWYLQKKFSVGPYSEQAIHLLDCVRFVLGNPKPIRAASVGAKNMVRYRKDLDAENALQLIYELDNGVFGSHTNHCGHDRVRWDLELIGPNLQLHANATEQVIQGTMNNRKIEEDLPAENSLGGLDKISAWLKAIETGDRKYIRSDYKESLNTQALIDAAIKSQSSNNMELAEKI
tara:strand:+ start:93 stop:1172 length:1080 start_codon:yes stop_codon:yes gene_type:complete